MRFLIAMLLALCVLSPAAPAGEPARILVFTRTAGFRHDSIPVAVDTVRELARQQGWQVDHGEDAGAFTRENLARYRVVVFASTTGDVLDDAQQAALQAFVERGGGFVGIHAAADTEYDWPWYGQLVGAWFKSHPPGFQATRVTFADDGIAAHGREWPVTDELYNYRDNPRPRVRVVATVDESAYEGGTMGADHPIAWCHPAGRGRAWYTGLGHRGELYADPTFRRHLLRGLRHAAGVSDAC